jgi:hypothetical protein
MRKFKPELYSTKYPHWFDEGQIIWVLQPGDIVKQNSKSYKVIGVKRSYVPGRKPEIRVIEL